MTTCVGIKGGVSLYVDAICSSMGKRRSRSAQFHRNNDSWPIVGVSIFYGCNINVKINDVVDDKLT